MDALLSITGISVRFGSVSALAMAAREDPALVEAKMGLAG